MKVEWIGQPGIGVDSGIGNGSSWKSASYIAALVRGIQFIHWPGLRIRRDLAVRFKCKKASVVSLDIHDPTGLAEAETNELTSTVCGATVIPGCPEHSAGCHVNSAFTIMLRTVSGSITTKESDRILENWARRIPPESSRYCSAENDSTASA
jgi:hypothetical protein